MIGCAPLPFGRRLLEWSCLAALAALLTLPVIEAYAADAVKLAITIKDQKFDPAELHAPAGQAIEIQVRNLNPIVSEFESSALHFEKIIPSGSQGVVFVRPLQSGRYNFYDDFHHATQGYLVVP